MNPYFLFTIAFGQMCALDSFLTMVGVKGAYYVVHGLHNTVVAYLTYGDVIYTFTNFNTVGDYPLNLNAVALVFSLHFYHIAMYFKKF